MSSKTLKSLNIFCKANAVMIENLGVRKAMSTGDSELADTVAQFRDVTDGLYKKIQKDLK